MKKILVVLISIALGMLLASSAMAAPGDGVVGSLHDLAVTYPADTADPLSRVCIYCHTPHHAYKLSSLNGGPGAGIGSGLQAGDDFTYLPLWNHDLTTSTFTPYWNGPEAPISGAKASQAIANGMVIGSSSLLCLSCHDGSIAVNAYGNADQPATSQGGGAGSVIGAQYRIGKDGYLGNHHPIGFSYDQAQLDDTGLRVSTTVLDASGGSIADHLSGPDGTMQCATCHSVHNKDNTGETLLWVTDTNSGFCLVCHDK